MSARRGHGEPPLPFGVLLAADDGGRAGEPRHDHGLDRDDVREFGGAGGARVHRREQRGPGRWDECDVLAPARPLPRRRDLRAGQGSSAGRHPAGGVDLFTPVESVGRQRPFAPMSPPMGIQVSGVLLGAEDWFTPTVEQPEPSEPTPARGVQTEYPRRRDLRRSGQQIPSQRGTAVPGSTFVPAPAPPEECTGGLPETDFPRRRDLRTGESERTGSLTVGVARAAVLTMLVGAGYAAVSGQHLHLPGLKIGDPLARTATGVNPAENNLALEPSAPAQDSGWDVSSEIRAARETGEKVEAARAAAARAAAARVAAAKAAAKARALARAAAMRDAQRNPKAVARLLASDRGWTGSQFTCLDLLWTRESGWNYRASNPYSGAYGIPQALPGSKMASIASDWRTNPVTQIKWGLSYIASRYGTPCGAWAHSQSTGWY